MLKISLILIILQSSIDVLKDNKIDGGEIGSNKTKLSNSSASKKSTKTGYPTFKDAKKGGGKPNSNGGNIKKDVEATWGSDYLTSGTKKAFNLLKHTFIQAPIFQHFDPKRYIRIETNVSAYAIAGVLTQLTLDDMG